MEKQLEETQNAVDYWKEVAEERRYVVEQRIANEHDWGQYEGKEYVYKGWNVRFDRVERDENGNVVVGADVKNVGREIEVNAISTAFGRRNDAIIRVILLM